MYKMLIVEDESIERNALATLVDWEALGLALAGCFESGEEALAYAKTHPFDVLFTDIRLLGMSGLDLAREVLALRPATKVIICSGYSDFEYARKAIRLKAVSYLTKPIDLEELRSTVTEAVRMIADESRMQRSAEKLDILVKTQLPVLREEILERVETGTVSGGEAADALRAIGMDTDRNIIRRIMAYVSTHLDQRLTAEHLAEVFHFSPNYIGIVFKKDTGKTLTDHVREVRMQKARALLLEPGSRIG